MTSSNELIPARTVRKTLGNISDMTIYRWLNDQNYQYLKFPKPIYIANRRYWRRSDIESWIDQQKGDAA